MFVAAPSTRPASAAMASAARILVAEAARAQQRWAVTPLKQRLAILRNFRRRLAADALPFAQAVERRHAGETIVTEIWPLLEASRYLERRARRILAPRRTATRGWPMPGRARMTVTREPHGVVLIIGPGNYGLMLAAVQALQALAAGNAAIIKPAPGARTALARFAQLLVEGGLPPGLLTILDESPRTAEALLESGVDRVIFTGSSGAGRQVLARAAARLVPAVLELSGWDACIVLDDANIDRVANMLAFTLRTNGGETCIAPRRVLVQASRAAELEERLQTRLREESALPFHSAVAMSAAVLIGDAVTAGARIIAGGVEADSIMGPVVLADVTVDMAIFSTEVFAPLAVISVFDRTDAAVTLANAAPHALGASVFGAVGRARAVAARLNAGLVTINDAVAPLADPDVPLEARAASGFGVTRGAEGLLAMTRAKAVTVPRSRFAPHYTLRPELFAEALAAFVTLVHGDLHGQRSALRTLLATRSGGRRREGAAAPSERRVTSVERYVDRERD